MKNNYLLHYLNHNQSFQVLKEFIKASYSFNLYLINLEGDVIQSSQEPSSSTQMLLKNKTSRISFIPEKAPYEGLPVLNIKKELLDELKEEKEAKIIEDTQSSYKKIFVPIIKDNEIFGFVYVGESENVRMRGAECKAMAIFLQDFMERLVKAELRFVEHFKDKEITHQQRTIKEVLEYVHDNYQTSCLTLREISSYKGVSYHYLSYLFKKELNINFKSYLNRVRLDAATKLLKAKNLSVSQVAYQCGFEDPGYFSKSFKEKMGVSPGDYRTSPTFQKTRRKTAESLLVGSSS